MKHVCASGRLEDERYFIYLFIFFPIPSLTSRETRLYEGDKHFFSRFGKTRHKSKHFFFLSVFQKPESVHATVYPDPLRPETASASFLFQMLSGFSGYSEKPRRHSERLGVLAAAAVGSSHRPELRFSPGRFSIRTLHSRLIMAPCAPSGNSLTVCVTLH